MFGGRRMLVASHIKPWKDSSPRERLDHRNGLAACPTHDAAFDAGLLAWTRISMSTWLTSLPLVSRPTPWSGSTSASRPSSQFCGCLLGRICRTAAT